jgi:hypothetical protein
LLATQAIVRVKVAPAESEKALDLLTKLAGAGRVSITDAGGVWLTARVAAERSVEVNRTLAGAGIFASGLEAGSDLESLFLQHTQPPAPEQAASPFAGWYAGGVR